VLALSRKLGARQDPAGTEPDLLRCSTTPIPTWTPPHAIGPTIPTAELASRPLLPLLRLALPRCLVCPSDHARAELVQFFGAASDHPVRSTRYCAHRPRRPWHTWASPARWRSAGPGAGGGCSAHACLRTWLAWPGPPAPIRRVFCVPPLDPTNCSGACCVELLVLTAVAVLAIHPPPMRLVAGGERLLDAATPPPALAAARPRRALLTALDALAARLSYVGGYRMNAPAMPPLLGVRLRGLTELRLSCALQIFTSSGTGPLAAAGGDAVDRSALRACATAACERSSYDSWRGRMRPESALPCSAACQAGVLAMAWR